MIRKISKHLLDEEKAQEKRFEYLTNPKLYNLARLLYIKFIDYVYEIQ